MNAKEAVKVAKKYLLEMLEDESPSNVGLEEIEFDQDQQIWRVTIGFSRPWNTTRNALTALGGEPAVKRAYRTIQIRDHDEEVLAMKRPPTLPDQL